MSLLKDRELTDDQIVIVAIKSAYRRLCIELDVHDIERRDLDIDASSLEDLLVNNLLHPAELQEMGPLTFDIGIEPEGTFVYADCWITNKSFAKKPRFEIAGEQSLGEFIRGDFRGAASIVCKCKSHDEIASSIKKVVTVIELLANSLNAKRGRGSI